MNKYFVFLSIAGADKGQLWADTLDDDAIARLEKTALHKAGNPASGKGVWETRTLIIRGRFASEQAAITAIAKINRTVDRRMEPWRTPKA